MKWRLTIIIFLATLSGNFLINACRKGQEDVPGKNRFDFYNTCRLSRTAL
jgi:hypothetical protein